MQASTPSQPDQSRERPAARAGEALDPSALSHRAERPKVALVTGAGRRMGRAIALGLAKAGWDVVVHYHRSAQDAEDSASAIR
ncbi:MAG: SDR family NAD(P)-dependent oxidoreductase, partial [Betaproteobacteria bacterium]|nr:SDR family NAD(P)-dependent oxidoreductase [Betaproteobacteria bacterium]